jgi:hypothetical protein
MPTTDRRARVNSEEVYHNSASNLSSAFIQHCDKRTCTTILGFQPKPLADFERYPGDNFKSPPASSSRYSSNIHANSREYDETVTRALNSSHHHSTARQGEYNTVTRVPEYHIVEHVPVYITETRESQRHREPQCYREPERYRKNTHDTDRYERIPSIRRLTDTPEARQRRKDRRRRKEPEREEGQKPNIKLTALERFAAHVVANL